MRALPLWPNPFPKASPHNTIALSIRFSTYEFEGSINIQTTADVKKNILQNCPSFGSYTCFCKTDGNQIGEATLDCSQMPSTCRTAAWSINKWRLPVCPQFWVLPAPGKCASIPKNWAVCSHILLTFHASQNCEGTEIECCHAKRLVQNLLTGRISRAQRYIHSCRTWSLREEIKYEGQQTNGLRSPGVDPRVHRSFRLYSGHS